MNRKKLLEVARRSPLFRSIGDRQLKKILGHFHIHRLEKGDFLFVPNNTAGSCTWLPKASCVSKKSHSNT